MSELECIKCKIKSTLKDTKNPIFPCDSCRRYYCGECSLLNASEVRCMPIQKRSLIFNCQQCRDGGMIKIAEQKIAQEMNKIYKTFEVEIMAKITNEMKKFREEIDTNYQKHRKEILKQVTGEMELLKVNKTDQEYSSNDLKAEMENKLEKYKNEIVQQLTYEVQTLSSKQRNYSEVVQSKHEKNEVLVITPKEKQDSNKTKSELKQKIDAKELAIAVENIKETKGGAVIINCKNKKTKETIKEKVENELRNYKVEEGIQKDPKIIIRGVEEEFFNGTDELVLECISEQNGFDSEELIVLKKYKKVGKRNSGNIILGVKNVTLKDKICREGKLNIGWRRCVVNEFFSVVRCFKCARYGHMASKCDNDETCFKCAGAHKTTDCKSESFKCINCSEANKKYKKSLREDHQVTDSNCECYKRLVELEAKKTKNQ